MDVTPTPGLDQLAADPGKATALPPEAAEALLAQVHIVQGTLLARLLAARAQSDGQPEEDRWLTPEEAAAFLGLTIPQLSRRRGLPRKKIGHRTVRYSLSALKRYLARV